MWEKIQKKRKGLVKNSTEAKYGRGKIDLGDPPYYRIFNPGRGEKHQ